MREHRRINSTLDLDGAQVPLTAAAHDDHSLDEGDDEMSDLICSQTGAAECAKPLVEVKLMLNGRRETLHIDLAAARIDSVPELRDCIAQRGSESSGTHIDGSAMRIEFKVQSCT